jgi:hypothetical protein
MHRSGTSMISSLLNKTGVYLGGDKDFLPSQIGENPDGFWEHFGFYALNERLLHYLGAGWDMPELPAGWASRNDIEPFREEASQLIQRMCASANGNGAWGWKDPRNSLTIQFWKSLLPDLQVVVCVRNPLEVAASLQRRNNLSLAASGRLWLRYYQNLMDNVTARNRVVTLYENYFIDPDAELRRLLGALRLPVNGTMAAACGLVNRELHHNQASQQQLLASEFDPQIIKLYARLRAEAGSAPSAPLEEAQPAAKEAPVHVESATDGDLLRSRFHAETAQREEHMRRLTQENTELRQTLDDLKAQFNMMRNDFAISQGKPHPYAGNLSAMVEQAIALHGLAARKRAQFACLQGHVESTLKETKPIWPRLIRCSNSINSLYRMVKRIRKLGKMSTLQRELNDVTFEALGTLTHMAAVITGHRSEEYVSPPGLERYAIEKTRMDVPKLVELLRIRLS